MKNPVNKKALLKVLKSDDSYRKLVRESGVIREYRTAFGQRTSKNPAKRAAALFLGKTEQGITFKLKLIDACFPEASLRRMPSGFVAVIEAWFDEYWWIWIAEGEND